MQRSDIKELILTDIVLIVFRILFVYLKKSPTDGVELFGSFMFLLVYNIIFILFKSVKKKA